MGNRAVVWKSRKMNGEGCGRILEAGGAVYDLVLVIMTLVLMKVHRTKPE